ncbi:MAG: peptide MFS transporter [Bacteroidales bacterium]|nr:peptide MFS transporter [Bacteroidales bacterium]
MFKGQPKGLFVTALANLGERFGYYTMIAIFVLFLQAKYGYSEADAGSIYATFLMFVYFLPLFGGIVADRWLGYKKTVTTGIVIMFIGYMLLAFPSILGGKEMIGIYVALGVISLGTGLFKGNLQALVGKLYDDPTYEKKRDSGFSVFYMFINLGAMFAPTAAQGVVNFVMNKSSLTYDSRIPELFHKMDAGALTESAKEGFLSIAQTQDASVTMDGLHAFGSQYVNALGGAYQLGFGVACLSLIASLLIFILGRKTYSSTETTGTNTLKNAGKEVEVMSPAETKERLVALFLVFAAVIFFWMAFHQNGLTLTYFARDYTDTYVGRLTNIWFDLFTLIPAVIALICAFYTVKRYKQPTKNVLRKRLIFGLVTLLCGIFTYARISGFALSNPFTPQLFQHFNPFFIVVLTPLSVGLFNWLSKKGKEPSAPRKIAYGMLVAAVAYILMSVASVGLLSPADRGDAIDYARVTPYWLISTYLTLTIAELFISPMGISFVSKVAPPKYKGMMQGCWFAATAIGNFLIQIGSHFWSRVPLWSLWMIFVVCCFLSAVFMFSIMKKLEKVAS